MPLILIVLAGLCAWYGVEKTIPENLVWPHYIFIIVASLMAGQKAEQDFHQFKQKFSNWFSK